MARRRNTQQMMSVQPLGNREQHQGGSLGAQFITDPILPCTHTHIHVSLGHMFLSGVNAVPKSTYILFLFFS